MTEEVNAYEPGELPAHMIASTAQAHFEAVQSAYQSNDVDATLGAATDAVVWLESLWDLENDGDFLEHMVCEEALQAAREHRNRTMSHMYLLYAAVTTVLRDFAQNWRDRL